MGQNDVIDSVRRYKQLVLENLGQAKVYLFGSYSKGTAREDSDIDVAVVVPKVEEDFLKTSSMLWMLTWNVNTLIEPVLIEEAHPSPLFDEVLRTGVLV